MITIRFCGVPHVRLKKVDGGWQVQRRSIPFNTSWTDVEQGFFFTKEEAVKEAPELCGF